MTSETATPKTCSFDPCGRPTYGHGLCRDHYRQNWRGQELSLLRADQPKCGDERCPVRIKVPGFCSAHRQKEKKPQRERPIDSPSYRNPQRMPCVFDGCENFQWNDASLCYWHSCQSRRGQDLRPVGKHGRDPHRCRHPRCYNDVISGSDLCRTHRDREGEPITGTGMVPCPIPGCSKFKRSSKILCQSHNERAKRYGLSPIRLRDMARAGCEVCGSVDRLAVDHDHSCCNAARSCGECVRGILCGNCNNMLGHGKTPETLRAGADYLERH